MAALSSFVILWLLCRARSDMVVSFGVLARVRLYESRGYVFRLSPVEFVFGWVVSDRASPRDLVGTVSECVIRNFSSHRVMRYTCRVQS